MHRVAVILLLAAAFAHAATRPSHAAGANVCDTFSEATVRTLTSVPAGGFSKHASHLPPFTERCVYGVTDGDLVLDISHFPTDAQAIAHLAALGSITNSVNNTDSPYGTDQVNQWTRLLTDSNDEPVYDVSGYAARHGSTVVALGLDRPGSDFSKEGIKRLQATALTTAGAHLVPWPLENVCARVPARAVETLVTLGPATILNTEQNSSGGNSTCEYEFHPFDSDDYTRVVLTASRWINDLEAIDGKRATSTAPSTLKTADKHDVILQVGDRDTVYALHAGDVGKVVVSSAEDTALHQPSYQAHMEEAALLAAGASVLPGPAVDAIPAPVEVTWFLSTRHQASEFLEHYWLLLLFALGIAWFIRSRYRRHQLILHGLPGTAVVNSISDTGITVNNSPVIRLHVTVTPPAGAPYNAAVNQTVSRLEAPATWVGRTVQVRIDPNNTQRFILV